MTRIDTAPARATWLYTCGEQSVWIDVHAIENAFHVVICGPHHRRARLEFPDAAALLAYQATEEAALFAQGYSLWAFGHERRMVADRRQWSRRIDRERRRPVPGPHSG